MSFTIAAAVFGFLMAFMVIKFAIQITHDLDLPTLSLLTIAVLSAYQGGFRLTTSSLSASSPASPRVRPDPPDATTSSSLLALLLRRLAPAFGNIEGCLEHLQGADEKLRRYSAAGRTVLAVAYQQLSDQVAQVTRELRELEHAARGAGVDDVKRGLQALEALVGELGGRADGVRAAVAGHARDIAALRGDVRGGASLLQSTGQLADDLAVRFADLRAQLAAAAPLASLERLRSDIDEFRKDQALKMGALTSVVPAVRAQIAKQAGEVEERLLAQIEAVKNQFPSREKVLDESKMVFETMLAEQSKAFDEKSDEMQEETTGLRDAVVKLSTELNGSFLMRFKETFQNTLTQKLQAFIKKNDELQKETIRLHDEVKGLRGQLDTNGLIEDKKAFESSLAEQSKVFSEKSRAMQLEASRHRDEMQQEATRLRNEVQTLRGELDGNALVESKKALENMLVEQSKAFEGMFTEQAKAFSEKTYEMQQETARLRNDMQQEVIRLRQELDGNALVESKMALENTLAEQSKAYEAMFTEQAREFGEKSHDMQQETARLLEEVKNLRSALDGSETRRHQEMNAFRAVYQRMVESQMQTFTNMLQQQSDEIREDFETLHGQFQESEARHEDAMDDYEETMRKFLDTKMRRLRQLTVADVNEVKALLEVAEERIDELEAKAPQEDAVTQTPDAVAPADRVAKPNDGQGESGGEDAVSEMDIDNGPAYKKTRRGKRGGGKKKGKGVEATQASSSAATTSAQTQPTTAAPSGAEASASAASRAQMQQPTTQQPTAQQPTAQIRPRDSLLPPYPLVPRPVDDAPTVQIRPRDSLLPPYPLDLPPGAQIRPRDSLLPPYPLVPRPVERAPASSSTQSVQPAAVTASSANNPSFRYVPAPFVRAPAVHPSENPFRFEPVAFDTAAPVQPVASSFRFVPAGSAVPPAAAQASSQSPAPAAAPATSPNHGLDMLAAVAATAPRATESSPQPAPAAGTDDTPMTDGHEEQQQQVSDAHEEQQQQQVAHDHEQQHPVTHTHEHQQQVTHAHEQEQQATHTHEQQHDESDHESDSAASDDADATHDHDDAAAQGSSAGGPKPKAALPAAPHPEGAAAKIAKRKNRRKMRHGKK